MLLVIVGGFALYRGCTPKSGPSREFLALEFAGADADHTGSCYSLETLLIANRIFSTAVYSWESPRKGAWTLTSEEVVQGYNGPAHRFQKFTFERVNDQVRLVAVDASKGLSTDLAKSIDELLAEPNDRKSTPVDRCAKHGGRGYRFRRQ